MRKLVFGIILLACVLAVAGCSVSTPQMEFNSQAGKFSILAPVALKEEVNQVDTPQGGKRDVHLFTGESGKLAYIVSYSDYPDNQSVKDPEALLTSVRQAAVVSASGGLLKGENKINLDGNTGREFTINFKGPNNEDWVSKTRAYLVGNRLYQVMVVADKGVAIAELDAFLNSFKLVK